MSNIDDEVLERLEAEAQVADAEAEELTIAVESDIESKDEEVEELQEQLDETESEVEELQEQVEEKEEQVEELQSEIEAVASTYAEELAANTEAFDEDELVERYSFEELREKHEDLVEQDASPAPNSGDPGAGFQTPDNGDGDGGVEEEELAEKAKVASEQFEERARKGGNSVWSEIADDVREKGLGEVSEANNSESMF